MDCKERKKVILGVWVGAVRGGAWWVVFKFYVFGFLVGRCCGFLESGLI